MRACRCTAFLPLPLKSRASHVFSPSSSQRHKVGHRTHPDNAAMVKQDAKVRHEYQNWKWIGLTLLCSQAAGDDTFRLLDLPTELQLRIFEFAVIEEEPITISMRIWMNHKCGPRSSDDYWPVDYWRLRKLWFGGPQIAKRTQPAIARTCRYIRAESLKIYYSQNKFEACYCSGHVEDCDSMDTTRWLMAIGEVNRNQMKGLVMNDGLGNTTCYECENGDAYACRWVMSTTLEWLGARMECISGEPRASNVIFGSNKE